jgi:hypothetical protein
MCWEDLRVNKVDTKPAEVKGARQKKSYDSDVLKIKN